MIIDSKYTKIFKSQDLTTQKYKELYDFAVFIRNHKNKVSDYINQNLLHYLDMSKFTFLKEMCNTFKGVISSSFNNQVYFDIFTAYQNKFEIVQKKLKFENITFQGFEFYKYNTKNYKKGDFKKIKLNKKQSPLTNCLTYLARYGNDNTVEYITKQLLSCDNNKKEFYNNILRCINKFGFDRLMNLALSKRQQVIKHYSRKPIEFKSLTFRGRSRKTKILDYNTNYNSVIKTFISLSGFKGRKSLDIPVKFSKDYHGNIKEYIKSNPEYEYIIKFDEYHKTISVHICKDGERYIPEAGDNVVGIDVNCKHNLFALSNETTYDYDRKLVNDFCKLSIEIDKLKENKEYKIGKRKQHKLDVLKMKMIKSEQRLISKMCKELKLQGVNHIVMEDLDNGFGRCYVKDSDNEDINYNRKIHFLCLSSLKGEVEHISRNYDIAVSTVHSSYTSKMCPICGCIEDENRPNQETFNCIECGYEVNADFNAANNIKNRVVLTVLRDKLLKKLDNGAYEPKKLQRDKVKEVLLSFRRNLQKVGSECIGSSLTTFEYV